MMPVSVRNGYLMIDNIIQFPKRKIIVRNDKLPFSSFSSYNSTYVNIHNFGYKFYTDSYGVEGKNDVQHDDE